MTRNKVNAPLFLLAIAALVACTAPADRSAPPDRDRPTTAQADALPDPFPASVTLDRQDQPVLAHRYIWGSNLPVTYNSAQGLYSSIDRDTIEALDVNMLRFPGGCQADLYDWKNSRQLYARAPGDPTIVNDVMPVTEALSVASDLGATLLYVVNVESRGLPNPCGQYSRHHEGLAPNARKAVLIQEAVELVTTHSIHYVELGNEPWGAWTADDYVAEAIEFAQALKSVRPYLKIALVGHPTTGNNMATDPDQQSEQKDLEWTARVQQALAEETCGIYERPCFDFVTDHPYSWAGYNPRASNWTSNYPGMGADYPLANYSWIFDQRVQDYDPARLAITEWNLKCWRVGTPTPVTINNSSFDAGITSWGFWQRHPGTGHAAHNTIEAHSGPGSIEIGLDQPSGNALDTAQASQSFTITAERRLYAYAWVKSDTPSTARLILQQTNAGAHQWHHVAESTLSNVAPGQWQEVLIVGETFADTTSVQVVLRVEKSTADWQAHPGASRVYFDDVVVEDTTGVSPKVAATKTIENGFFTFESLMLMAVNGVGFSNYHTLSKGHCGFFNGTSALDPSGQTFALSNVTNAFKSPIAHMEVVEANVTSPTITTPVSGCTAPGCLASEVDVPVVSAYAFRWPSTSNIYFVYAVNRDRQSSADFTINLGDVPAGRIKKIVRTGLTAPNGDYTGTSFDEAAEEVTLNPTFPAAFTLPPVSITRFELRFRRQWNVSTEVVCADGQPPTSPDNVQMFTIRWPKAGDTPHDFDLTVGDPSLAPQATVVSEDDVSSVYVGLITESGQWDEPLVADDDTPHTAITAGTWFNPSTPMVQWRSHELPAGSYTLRYLAPDAWCQ